MALIVPLLAFAALFWTYWRRDAGANPRGALLAASVTWGVFATGIVETLSQVEWLTEVADPRDLLPLLRRRGGRPAAGEQAAAGQDQAAPQEFDGCGRRRFAPWHRPV